MYVVHSKFLKERDIIAYEKIFSIEYETVYYNL